SSRPPAPRSSGHTSSSAASGVAPAGTARIAPTAQPRPAGMRPPAASLARSRPSTETSRGDACYPGGPSFQPMPNWLLFLVTLAPRLPFIWVGYGVHTDGWRVVRTVSPLLSGEYATSRPPGYPLPEAILTAVAAVFGDPPAVVNLVTAFYSA